MRVLRARIIRYKTNTNILLQNTNCIRMTMTLYINPFILDSILIINLYPNLNTKIIALISLNILYISYLVQTLR